MPRFTIHEAKTNLSELIRRAEAGEEIVIARGDKPVAVLEPFAGRDVAARRKAGMNSLKGGAPLPDDAALFGAISDDEFVEMFGQDFLDLHGPASKAAK